MSRTLLRAADHASRLGLRLRGFRARMVETSVCRTHVLEADGHGDGPPVLVLHGINAAAVQYASVLPQLRATASRVVAPDMPGHGFSERPADGVRRDTVMRGLFETLDQVIDEPVVFFGNSLGGLAAIRYALRRPENVAALLLSSPGGAQVPHDELQEFLDNFRMTSSVHARRFLRKLFVAPPWYLPLIAPGVLATFRELRELVDEVGPEDLVDPEDLRRLAMPMLLLWGRGDLLMPKTHLAFYRKHLPPHCLVEEPDELGHCPYLDRPAQLAEHINRFVRRVATGPMPL